MFFGDPLLLSVPALTNSLLPVSMAVDTFTDIEPNRIIHRPGKEIRSRSKLK